MKTFAAFALVLATLAPAVAAQTAAGVTGKWEGTFTLAIVKDRLQGEMTGERDGAVRGRAKVDAARAK
jgi:hypothetical protein